MNRPPLTLGYCARGCVLKKWINRPCPHDSGCLCMQPPVRAGALKFIVRRERSSLGGQRGLAWRGCCTRKQASAGSCFGGNRHRSMALWNGDAALSLLAKFPNACLHWYLTGGSCLSRHRIDSTISTRLAFKLKGQNMAYCHHSP